MKHPLPTTVLIVALFAAAQIIGLSLLVLNIDEIHQENGQTIVEHAPTIVGERPETTGAQSLLFIGVGVLFGTIAVLLLIKFKAYRIWKVWFFLAVFLALSVAFGVVMPELLAFVLAVVLAAWKIFRPNPVIHNLTEIFLYAGIAVLIGPLFDLWWAVILLVLISIYDVIAVWHSKHMVTMAKAQAESNLFAGLYIPRTLGKKTLIKRKGIPAPPIGKENASHAILGGGDIAFPLIFSGSVLTWLVESRSLAPSQALFSTLVVTLCATIALSFLFWRAKKDKFYPAMPVLTLGCLIGWAIIAIF